MVNVYCTDEGWFCSCGGQVTYHQNLREAMDAAYRQATRDGAPKQGHPNSNDG